MRTPGFKPQSLGIVDGFKIVLSFHEEYENAKHHFIDVCGWTHEEYKEISNFYWFTARITAYKGNIECGNAYLGACCHKSLKDIMQNGEHKNVLGGYAPQMIEEAIDEAQRELAA